MKDLSMGPLQVVLLYVRVAMGIMALKDYSTLPSTGSSPSDTGYHPILDNSFFGREVHSSTDDAVIIFCSTNMSLYVFA